MVLDLSSLHTQSIKISVILQVERNNVEYSDLIGQMLIHFLIQITGLCTFSNTLSFLDLNQSQRRKKFFLLYKEYKKCV